MNVLLFSCNPIGQLCLGGLSYSSRTVIITALKYFLSIYLIVVGKKALRISHSLTSISKVHYLLWISVWAIHK